MLDLVAAAKGAPHDCIEEEPHEDDDDDDEDPPIDIAGLITSQ